jgi:hypothetical protein
VGDGEGARKDPVSAIDLKGFGGFGSLFGQTSSEYTVRRARYAKGQALVQVKSTGGMKGRAARLLHALKCKFVNREGGYSCSPSKLAKFEKMMREGWDANFFSDELIPPGGDS